MIWRVSLSVGARMVYIALDDMARERGDWFIRHGEFARKLGASPRQIRRWLVELQNAGHVLVKRTGRSNVHQLLWASGQAVENRAVIGHPWPIRVATGGLSECPPVADRLLNVFYPGTSPERPTVRCACGAYFEPSEECVRCQRCGHSHVPGCDVGCSLVVSTLEETRTLLAGYVRQCRLSWPAPDDSVCDRVFAAAGGLPELEASLRDLLLNKHAAPGRSYMWFVTVLGKRKAG
jgi:hypothetical protein